ncbi:MAG: hypothetical protein Q8P93_00610, partial [bacterium]|nr:hypothetical protein [bacterium]
MPKKHGELISRGQGYELLNKLEAAGLDAQLAQKVVDSKDNDLAAKVVTLIQNGGFEPRTSQKLARAIMGLSPNPNLNPKKANRKVFSAKRLDFLSLNSNSFCFFSFVLFLFPKHIHYTIT